jgi:hypothetical protein
MQKLAYGLVYMYIYAYNKRLVLRLKKKNYFCGWLSYTQANQNSRLLLCDTMTA